MKFLLLLKWLFISAALLVLVVPAMPLFLAFSLIDGGLTTEFLEDMESTITVLVLNDFRGL